MTDNPQNSGQPENKTETKADDQAAGPRMEMRKIYIKDISFESPASPDIFARQDAQPKLDMQITISHKRIDPDGPFYEVVLNTTVTAKDKERAIFLAEVQQAGIFEIDGMQGEQLSMVLEIACPNALLPFAREAVSDLVGKGGFPQLLLNPVNFEMLYMQKKQQQAAKAGTAPDPSKVN